MIREYIVSEAMAALGVPTTRALAAVASGESVLRPEGSLPGGVFTRIAASHIRVGTFQYYYARNDLEGTRLLADYVIARHYPEAADSSNPYGALISSVAKAQADLIAQWMSLGFIHGVMNTDNMAISGETIDYGPCAFMDTFHPQCVFSSIDRGARYAWGNQPDIGLWNLTRFAETLLPLLSENAEEAVSLAQGSLPIFRSVRGPVYHPFPYEIRASRIRTGNTHSGWPRSSCVTEDRFHSLLSATYSSRWREFPTGSQSALFRRRAL